MSTKIVAFPLDKETGYPGLIPMNWPGDPRKLYAAARWLKKLLDSGDYAHLIKHNDDDFFTITQSEGKFQISIPSFASAEALYILVDMLRGMGGFLWFDLFGRFHYSAIKNKPKIFTPNPPGVAGQC